MRKSNAKEFIEKARRVHGNKYDYNRIVYVDCKIKMEIYCIEHNKYFWQNSNNHLQGQGCPCGKIERISKSNSKYDHNSFIKKSKKIHGNKYDYSNVKYKEVKVNVEIKCIEHNASFLQSPYTHLRGAGCPKCANRKTISHSILGKDAFIHKSIEKHGRKYDYRHVEYKNNHTKIKIICNNHPDNLFLQSPQKHLAGRGCPLCNSSDGENIIRGFLVNSGFVFKEQKMFEECRFIKKLKFDFYLYENNTIIEYNGIQHYKEIPYYHKGKYNLDHQKNRDKIKRDYAENNNIKLIEIPYWDKKNIQNILKKELGL